jgi:hypothetical protein
MAWRIVLLSIRISDDAEQFEWHLGRHFSDSVGKEKLDWLKKNYPHLPIMRKAAYHEVPNQMVYSWFVDFPDAEGFSHYMLTYGYEDGTK